MWLVVSCVSIVLPNQDKSIYLHLSEGQTPKLQTSADKTHGPVAKQKVKSIVQLWFSTQLLLKAVLGKERSSGCGGETQEMTDELRNESSKPLSAGLPAWSFLHSHSIIALAYLIVGKKAEGDFRPHHKFIRWAVVLFVCCCLWVSIRSCCSARSAQGLGTCPVS